MTASLDDRLVGTEPTGVRIQIIGEQKNTTSDIVVMFITIRKVGVGYDGKPYICFDTSAAPILEESVRYGPTTGKITLGSLKCRKRKAYLHPGHEQVAPFAHHLRVVLYRDHNTDVIDKFVDLCAVSDLGITKIIRNAGIDAHRQNFYSVRALRRLRLGFDGLSRSTVYQLEALMYNGLLHSRDVADLTSILHRPSQSCRNYGNTSLGESISHLLALASTWQA